MVDRDERLFRDERIVAEPAAAATVAAWVEAEQPPGVAVLLITAAMWRRISNPRR